MTLNTVSILNWFVYKWQTKKSSKMMATLYKVVDCLESAHLKVQKNSQTMYLLI